ncbi:hypothetical protein ACFFIX_21900 [Metabacillus herbersteinensis]|uniref:Uncharacterized protein n=1 Tax=Metabacillus herbersteinensis TaxID=283816 RepID=A0ABV6GJZ3_9BACI
MDDQKKQIFYPGDETVMFLRITEKEMRYYGKKKFNILYVT